MPGHLAQASPGVTGYKQRQKNNVAGRIPIAFKYPAHPQGQVPCIPHSLLMGNIILPDFYWHRERCTEVAQHSLAHATPARASPRLQSGSKLHPDCHRPLCLLRDRGISSDKSVSASQKIKLVPQASTRRDHGAMVEGWGDGWPKWCI